MGMLKKIIPAIIFGVVYASSFFSYPARTIMFAVTISVNTLTMLFKDKFNVDLFKKGEKEDPKEKLIGVALPTLIGFLIIFIAPYSDSHNFFIIKGGDILRYFGLIIFLGKQFSWLVTLQEEHELITDGPFRYMRHPRYSGIILWVFGVALIFLSIAGLVLAVLMSALMLLRIPKEEKLLHGEFGEKWEEYCKTTAKKLIPFVY
jgi:protein-S-isoprenylcysteine O-methyltransferase Ste14